MQMETPNLSLPYAPFFPKPVTHVRAMVKWKRWRSPLKVMKEWAGKLRVLIWQKGFS